MASVPATPVDYNGHCPLNRTDPQRKSRTSHTTSITLPFATRHHHFLDPMKSDTWVSRHGHDKPPVQTYGAGSPPAIKDQIPSYHHKYTIAQNLSIRAPYTDAKIQRKTKKHRAKSTRASAPTSRAKRHPARPVTPPTRRAAALKPGRWLTTARQSQTPSSRGRRIQIGSLVRYTSYILLIFLSFGFFLLSCPRRRLLT
jgi:hypothetical protein